MNSQVIIFVCDDNYINHVKAISVNCRLQGKYNGDFAVICPTGSAAAQTFREYGFYVLEKESTGFLQKFSVFDEYFIQWKECCYLDCDIIVQDDLQRVFSLLQDHYLWMDTEDGPIIEMFFRDTEKEKHPEVYKWMEQNYPHINTHRKFNTAFILFTPENLSWGIPEILTGIQEKIESANRISNGGTDQQVINLLLWHETKPIPDKLTVWWGFDEPENRVYSGWREWVGDEHPVALHFSRWYAPWIEKKPHMAAYRNNRLEISNNELYLQNLSKFDELFKKQP